MPAIHELWCIATNASTRTIHITYTTSKNESRDKTAIGEVEAEEKAKHQNNCSNNSIVGGVSCSVCPNRGCCSYLMVGLNQHNYIVFLLCESCIASMYTCICKREQTLLCLVYSTPCTTNTTMNAQLITNYPGQ